MPPAEPTPLGSFETRAVHAGQRPDPTTGAVVPPIYQTSTFAQQGIGRLRGGYEYARAANPSRSALEEQVAALEGGARCLAFASGMAAVDALLRTTVRPGDRVVVGADSYGGSLRLLDSIYSDWGVATELVDLRDLATVRAAVGRPRTRLLLGETPSNPLLNIADIAALADIAHQAGVLLAIDNTLASPFLQRPLHWGADIVVHSTTKYLGGHSDSVGGAVVVDDEELAERLAFTQFAAGAVSAPMDSWLTTRAIKTLGVRMRRHSDSATELATWLAGHPAVQTVYYPGLRDHPGHDLALRQMDGTGGMVSVLMAGADHADAVRAARRLVESTRLFTLAESLGGVESLIGYPHMMSHGYQRGTPLEVDARLVRLSVGLEDPGDLRDDLHQALGS